MELNKNLILTLLATGMSANTFAANDSNPDVVETRRDTLKLSEVVVVGYGKMRRKDVTSSITTIQSSDLNQGVYTSPAQLLQGKAERRARADGVAVRADEGAAYAAHINQLLGELDIESDSDAE